MERRVLAFLETVTAGQERRPRERAMLQTLAWLQDRCAMTAELVLWGDTPLPQVPAPLAGARLHRLVEMPPTSLMSTVDLAACATGFIKAFRPDVVLVSTSPVNSNLHLLAAAFAFLQPAGFIFGVTEIEPCDPPEPLLSAEPGFLCRRPAAGSLLESIPRFPVVLGITHCAGIEGYDLVPAPQADPLPLGNLGLELELIQMRSALFPEPVSIIQNPESRLSDLETAVNWLTADEEEE